MKHTTSLIVLAGLLAPVAIQAQQAATPQPSQPPTQAQMQAACLAALPPAPKPPSAPQRSLFPGLQAKINAAIRKAGGDPDAMIAAAQQAAQQKYQVALQAYQQKRNACFASTPVPVTLPVTGPLTAAKPAPALPPATPQKPQ
jgi:hypothetical protein